MSSRPILHSACGCMLGHNDMLNYSPLYFITSICMEGIQCYIILPVKISTCCMHYLPTMTASYLASIWIDLKLVVIPDVCCNSVI